MVLLVRAAGGGDRRRWSPSASGRWTGLSSSAFALDPLALPDFDGPTSSDFLWTIPLALAIALGAFSIFAARRDCSRCHGPPRSCCSRSRAGRRRPRDRLRQATDKAAQRRAVLRPGPVAGLVDGAGTWSLSALALLIVFKGLAWRSRSPASAAARRSPRSSSASRRASWRRTSPASPTTPAVAVGMGAAVVAVLRLPLSAVVLAALLTVATRARVVAAHHRRRRRRLHRHAGGVAAGAGSGSGSGSGSAA